MLPSPSQAYDDDDDRSSARDWLVNRCLPNWLRGAPRLGPLLAHDTHLSLSLGSIPEGKKVQRKAGAGNLDDAYRDATEASGLSAASTPPFRSSGAGPSWVARERRAEPHVEKVLLLFV